MKNVKRTLSVRAVTDVKLLALSREAFKRILGSIRDYLKEDYQKGDQSLDTSFESSDSSNE